MVLLDVRGGRRALQVGVSLLGVAQQLGELSLALARDVVAVLAMPVKHAHQQLRQVRARQVHQVRVLVGLAAAVERASGVGAHCPDRVHNPRAGRRPDALLHDAVLVDHARSAHAGSCGLASIIDAGHRVELLHSEPQDSCARLHGGAPAERASEFGAQKSAKDGRFSTAPAGPRDPAGRFTLGKLVVGHKPITSSKGFVRL